MVGKAIFLWQFAGSPGGLCEPRYRKWGIILRPAFPGARVGDTAEIIYEIKGAKIGCFRCPDLPYSEQVKRNKEEEEKSIKQLIDREFSGGDDDVFVFRIVDLQEEELELIHKKVNPEFEESFTETAIREAKGLLKLWKAVC